MQETNIIGKRFGRLTVVKKTRLKDNRIGWLCRCDCGNKKTIRTNHLLNGETKSCGCLKKEVNKTHGKRNTPTYNIWSNMKQRCINKNGRGYKNYGGRGIKVCDRWLNSFENFLEDMGERPVKLTLDRIDNDGDYCKENCRWATRTTQNRNSRHCNKLTFNGETLTLREWSEKLDIKVCTLNYRVYVAKWDIKDVLTKKKSL